MWWDYYIWLLVNKKESIIEKVLDFLLFLSAIAFVGSIVISGLLFLGTCAPDNGLWLIPQEPSRDALTEMSLLTYRFFRGMMIVIMATLYGLAVGVLLVPFIICFHQHSEEFREEYEEELRLKQLYDKSLRGKNLNSALLYV
jgi:hypothetical protein